MAIVYISQIKHRRGLRSEVPKPSLEEGELGLVLDTGEVLIGTPNLPEAAARASRNEFPWANTQILTEWADNVGQLLRYEYRHRKEIFDPQTGSVTISSSQALPILQYTTSAAQTISKPIVRKLQERLDEWVSVKSYGARGDGYRDGTTVDYDFMISETAALRRAALDVAHLNISSVRDGWKPKSLFFPAGVYVINNPLLLPPFSHWVGEGRENTIILLNSLPQNVVQGYNDCMIFTVNGSLLPEDAMDDSVIPLYSYSNIGTNPDLIPQDIVIENITFIVGFEPNLTLDTPFDVLRLIGVKNALFKNCSFVGNWAKTLFSPAAGYEHKSPHNTNDSSHYFGGVQGILTGDSIAIVVDSFDTVHKPDNVVFENCLIANTTYGCLLTDDLRNVIFDKCTFNRHYRGISLNEDIVLGSGSLSKTVTKGTYGPKNVSVTNSLFINVKREAISNFSTLRFDDSDTTTEYHQGFGLKSINNRFENVGNNFTNDGNFDTSTITVLNPQYSVINFSNSYGNASIGDTFGRVFNPAKVGRTYGQDAIRIDTSYTGKNIVISQFEPLELPTQNLILSANTAIWKETGIAFDMAKIGTMKIDYVMEIEKGGTTHRRRGEIIVTTDGSFGVTSAEEYDETTTINIELSAFASAQTAELKYVSLEGTDATLSYVLIPRNI